MTLGGRLTGPLIWGPQGPVWRGLSGYLVGLLAGRGQAPFPKFSRAHVGNHYSPSRFSRVN